jgi:hypothetical protein
MAHPYPSKKLARFSPRERRPLAKIAPVEELHRVVGRRVIDAVVVDLDERGCDSCVSVRNSRSKSATSRLRIKPTSDT